MKLIIQFVSGPALSCRSLVSGPGALDVRPRPLSLPGPSALCVGARRSRCSLCRAQRSLCRGPALSVSGPSTLPVLSVRAPAVSVGACFLLLMEGGKVA